ncbi:MAG: hypothetical protein ACK58N_11940 [Synechocystis sp.]
MTDFSSGGTLLKLSIGDVVTAGLRIYRDHFKPYYWQAVQSYLWIALAVFISVIVLGGVTAIGAVLDPTAFVGILILVVLALFVPWGYCLAKSIAVQGVLARVAFFEAGEQPESLAAARIQLMPRFWRFLWASLLTGLVMILCLAIVGGIFAFLLIMGGLMSFADPNGGIVIILSFAWIFVGIFIYIWVFSRLALTDVCLAVEPTLSPLNAVNRSWALTKGYVLTLQMIFFIAFLMTSPLSILSNFGSVVALLAGQDENMATIINLPLSILIGALLIPFWQAIK